MSQKIKRFTGRLCLIVLSLAFAAFAIDFITVDSAVYPPAVSETTSHELEFANVSGGVFVTLNDQCEDLLVVDAATQEIPAIGYFVLSEDMRILHEAEGGDIPVSTQPDAEYLFLFSLDGTPLEASSILLKSSRDRDLASNINSPVDLSSQAQVFPADDSVSALSNPSSDEEVFYSLDGEFAVTVSITEPFGDFSILGLSEPGGTTTTSSIPEFEASGPGHSNVCEVVASGGSFIPRKSGLYAFQISADDHAELMVGDMVASAEWLNGSGDGEIAYGRFKANVAYPISLNVSSVGGPAHFSVLKFAEYVPATNEVRIQVSPNDVKFSRKKPGEECTVATQLGEGVEGLDYEIKCISSDGGLIVSNDTASVDKASDYWDVERSSTVTFGLYEEGILIDSESAVFTLLPEKEEAEDDCCCIEGTTTELGSVSFSQTFGRTPWIPNLPTGRVAIKETYPVSRLWTSRALVYDHPMTRRAVFVKGETVVDDGRPLDVIILNSFGEGNEYKDGKPVNMSSGLSRGVYRLDGDLVEVLENRTEIKYDAQTGLVKALRPPDGTWVRVEDLGINIEYDASGAIKSIVSLSDGRMDVGPISNFSYQLQWSSRSGTVAKTFVFSGDGSGIFRLTERRSALLEFVTEWRYDSAAQDWIFAKAPGTEAVKTRKKEIAYDLTNNVWNVVYKTLNNAGEVERLETSVLDVSNRSIMETDKVIGGKRQFLIQRNTSGTVASKTDSRGCETAYKYDEWNRVTNELSTVNGGIVREIVLSYPELPPVGGVVDRRVAHRIVKENGIIVEEEETFYLTNKVVNIRKDGVASRTSFNEFDNFGRTILLVDEIGRASKIEYAEYDPVDYSWIQTRDNGVWSEDEGFSLVNGKSTRTVITYDVSGNAVSVVNYAYINNAWHETDWTTNRYNAAHKNIYSLKSDGKELSSDWICTGPLWIRSEDGILTTNVFNEAKEILYTTRISPLGSVRTEYIYDAEGRVICEKETSEGLEERIRTRQYDEQSRLIRETDAQNRTTTYNYSDDGRVTTIVYPSGAVRITTLNSDGSIHSITGTSDANEYWTYGVTDDGLRWEKVNYLSPDGARWIKTYTNAFGERVLEERPGANGSILITEMIYNDKGQLIEKLQTGKPREVRTYDVWGDAVSVERAAGGKSQMRAVATGYILYGGNVWRNSSSTIISSDSSIAPLVTTNMSQISGLSHSNESRNISYDVRGNKSEMWTSLDPVASTRMTYSAVPTASNIALTKSVDGVEILSVSHSAVTNSIVYDAYRRAKIQVDGRGNATTNEYDSLGRLASVTDAAGSTTRYAYDEIGNLAAITNASGIATVYEYDLRGNKIYEGGGTYPVSYAYNGYNVMTNMTTYRAEHSSNGDVTVWNYDDATGLLFSKIYADGKGPAYTYTDNGNLATRTWARGVVTTYSYDGWNNLTNTTYSDGTPSITFVYDALGRQISATDTVGTTTTIYDDFGEVVGEATIGLYSKSKTRHRDAFGRDLGYTLDNSRKNIIEYEPDTARIKRVMFAGAWYTYGYLPGTDLKSSLTVGTAGRTDWTYEPTRDLLTQVKNTAFGSVVSQYDYVNDAIERRTEISRSGTRMTETRSDAYGYNDRNELTNAVKNATLNEYAYQYDDIGNRLSSRDLGEGRQYESNNLNQYVSIAESEDEFTPQFDDDGNQTLVKTSTGIWQVVYNGENRPVSWTCGSTNITMKFDRMGRRVEYVETVNGSTNTHHRFVYDGYLCFQRLNGASNNAVDLAFGWDPTEPVATRPLWMQRVSGTYNFFYFHDGNKNVSELVSYQTSRGVPAHYEYAPFGALTTATTNTAFTAFDVALTNPFRFSSEYTDGALGLVYYNYRHYEPLIGRWLSRDPAENLSSYLFLQNTVFGVDVLGLFGEDVHYYYTYLYLALLQKEGIEVKFPAEIARGALAPDIYTRTSAYIGWIDSQALYHNLNGLSAAGVRCYRCCVYKKIQNEKTELDAFSLGLLIHVLGDTYAHTKGDGSAYHRIVGHGLYGTRPDNVRLQFEKFKEFANDLSLLFGDDKGVSKNLVSRIEEMLKIRMIKETQINLFIFKITYSRVDYAYSLKSILEELSKEFLGEDLFTSDPIYESGYSTKNPDVNSIEVIRKALEACYKKALEVRK